MKAVDMGSGVTKLTITSSGEPTSRDCKDQYWLATVTGIQRFEVRKASSWVVEWDTPADANDAEKWDVATKGVRIFEFTTPEATTVANLLQTALLDRKSVV